MEVINLRQNLIDSISVIPYDMVEDIYKFLNFLEDKKKYSFEITSEEFRKGKKLINSDDSIILYTPRLKVIAKTVTATILLSRMIYLDNQNDGKEFFKFLEPCNHPDYIKGSSWIEELGITAKQFRTAFKRLEEQGLVSKRVDGYNRTFYKLNKKLLKDL